MKKTFLSFLLISILALIAAGCATKSTIQQLDNNVTHIPPTAKFMVTKVIDHSKYVGKPGSDEENFDIVKELETRVLDELEKEQIKGEDFKISMDILEYSPGNAFGRWLMPGVGSTTLTVACEIQTSEGKPIFKSTVERGIHAGGGYTIGAWKTIFGTVAQEIVSNIKKLMDPTYKHTEEVTPKAE